jgi:hypothetical protein
MIHLNLPHAIIFLGISFMIFSCEKDEGNPGEDDTRNSIELVSDSIYVADFLPDNYDLSAWYDYYEENNEFPKVTGRYLEYTIEVKANDNENNPLESLTINFSADGGEIIPATSVTNADGVVTALWKFDGSWELWGDYTLLITAFDTDGQTHLKGSPIIVESQIVAPPGV